MGKPIGPRFVQMVSNTPEWEMPFKIGVYYLPLTTRNHRVAMIVDENWRRARNL